MKFVKKTAVSASPLLLFVILFIPYNLINQKFIVKWLGCGCPIVDEAGNIIENNFNANDFTALFWLGISILATIISFVLSKKILKEKTWSKVLYVTGILLISLFITYIFIQIMMWN